MLSIVRFASLRRPRGLAARAVLLTTGLMALTAALCVGIVLMGADREGARQQLAVAHDLTTHLAARTAGSVIQRSPDSRLHDRRRGAARRAHDLHPRCGRGVLAQAGGSAGDIALADHLTRAGRWRDAYLREAGRWQWRADHARWRTARRRRSRVGRSAYRFDPFASLAPFFCCWALGAPGAAAHGDLGAPHDRSADALARFADALGWPGRADRDQDRR